MDIQIVEHTKEQTQVIIKCQKINDSILRLKTHIELFEKKLTARTDDKICFVNLSEVLYFEAVDNHVFVYTQDSVMEIQKKLYELELLLPEKGFLRTSKSQIVNIGKISSLKPELNRTILATLCNGERLSISRKYVPALKNLLTI